MLVTCPKATKSALAAGFTSHFISAAFPFIAGACLKQLGVFPASAFFYLVGLTLIICICIAKAKYRNELTDAISCYLQGGLPWQFSASLFFFAIAGAGYYLGLNSAERKLEYIYLTRLDFVLQVPVGIVFLREKWNSKGLAGAAIAAVGGCIIAWKGAFGPSGIWWGMTYVASSLAAYALVTSVLQMHKRFSPFVMLSARTVAVLFVFTVLSYPSGTWNTDILSWPHLLLTIAAGSLLFGMFWLRFAAIKEMPLWVFSALAPIQALGATIIAASLGQLPGIIAMSGVLLVVIGELLVAFSYAKTAK